MGVRRGRPRRGDPERQVHSQRVQGNDNTSTNHTYNHATTSNYDTTTTTTTTVLAPLVLLTTTTHINTDSNINTIQGLYIVYRERLIIVYFFR